MPVVAIPSLPSLLLEQIVTKLDWKSYLRLQRTCKQMNEFVRTNRNTKAVLKLKLVLGLTVTSDEHGSCQLESEFRLFGKIGPVIDIDSLYGIRVRALAFLSGVQENNFSPFCNLLRKYRITAEALYTDNWQVELAKDQWQMLFKILKPVKIYLLRKGPMIFGVLSDLKHLEGLEVSVNIEDAPTAVRQFLSMPEMGRLYIKVGNMYRNDSYTLHQIFRAFEEAIQIIRSQPLAKLHHFMFNVYQDCKTTSIYELIEMFQCLLGRVWCYSPLEMCHDFLDRPGVACQLRVDTHICGTQLLYNKEYHNLFP